MKASPLVGEVNLTGVKSSRTSQRGGASIDNERIWIDGKYFDNAMIELRSPPLTIEQTLNQIAIDDRAREVRDQQLAYERQLANEMNPDAPYIKLYVPEHNQNNTNDNGNDGCGSGGGDG